MKIPRILRRRFFELGWSRLPRSYPPSAHPVTILIPLAAKDIASARICVASLRRHLLHPIEDIVIAGQDHAAVRDFCHSEKLVYLNETEVLPQKLVRPSAIPAGHPVNGWLRQQFLKLTAFDYLPARLILTQDADTFLVRNISFMSGERQICFLSDEYTQKFYHFPRLLLDGAPRHPRSFVAHSMLWQKDMMEALGAHVKLMRGAGLVDSILADLNLENAGWLSEFEIYGNYLHNFQRERLETRYWYNRKLPPGPTPELFELERRYRRYNSVSAHVR